MTPAAEALSFMLCVPRNTLAKVVLSIRISVSACR